MPHWRKNGGGAGLLGNRGPMGRVNLAALAGAAVGCWGCVALHGLQWGADKSGGVFALVIDCPAGVPLALVGSLWCGLVRRPAARPLGVFHPVSRARPPRVFRDLLITARPRPPGS